MRIIIWRVESEQPPAPDHSLLDKMCANLFAWARLMLTSLFAEAMDGVGVELLRLVFIILSHLIFSNEQILRPLKSQMPNKDRSNKETRTEGKHIREVFGGTTDQSELCVTPVCISRVVIHHSVQSCFKLVGRLLLQAAV